MISTEIPSEQFRHLRNKEDKLFCTVCTLKTKKETAIGVAFCSEQDQFSRKTGRQLSYARACIAMKEERNSFPIYLESDTELKIEDKADIIVYCAKPVFYLLQYKNFDKLVPLPMKSIYIKEDSE